MHRFKGVLPVRIAALDLRNLNLPYPTGTGGGKGEGHGDLVCGGVSHINVD